MRVGLTTSVIQRGQSGIGQYVLALVRAFMRYRNRNQFVLFVLEEDLPLFAFAESKMEIIPVPERFRPPEQDILWHQWHLPAQAHRHHLDVLHVPSYRRMLWRHPCALVTTIHDLAPFHVERKYDWKRMLYARVVARLLAHRQHEIIAVSENTAQDIAHYFGVSTERLTVIHNGVDHDRFSPGSREHSKSAARERYGLHDPFFLYVARLEHPAKNHVRLIEAFNQFKAETFSPWQLVLAGGDWQGADVIRAAVRKSFFETDIHCLGFVPDDDLATLVKAADIFVYPSLHEGFGLPPLEAMACRCPVICSDRGALDEVVAEAAAKVDPENVGALKWQMTRMVNNQELREKWAAAGLIRSMLFDWNRTASATLRIYARALAKTKDDHVRPVVEDLLTR
jgi:glycosyltransferase involved in cell wall biosynthesis